MRKQTIVYVNFSPYDNAGRILDYLTSSFSRVIHFSYDHLRLQNGRRTNILTVYRNGEVVERRQLIPFRSPESLRFPSLPGVALLILLQTWWHTRRLGKKYNTPVYYLTVNAYTAWIGTLLKRAKLVKKTIFWVWDYYPPQYPDWRIRFLRTIYWKFDKPSMISADILAFISDKLINLRHDFRTLPEKKPYRIIPIGTHPQQMIPKKRKAIIGYLGMMKQSQGLDFLFDALPRIHKELPHVVIEIIGSGPQEDYFRKKARRWKHIVQFTGYIEKEADVDAIMRRWAIGYAAYKPVESNEAYWTDPSKIKAYISHGIPVLTTDVPYFSRQIAVRHAGKIIPYGDQKALIAAIRSLLAHKQMYAANALSLAKRYRYQRVYQKFFKR